jgi:enediyne biosynthesis protein E4
LGADAGVQSLEVRWPSGIRQTLKDVHGDQFLKIEEPRELSWKLQR